VNILFASQVEKAESWLPLLESALPRDRFFAEPRADVDIVLAATPPPGTFERLPALKLVQSLWMGVEKLLEEPALPAGVPLARLVDPGMVAAMTETVLACVLDWHRHLYRYRDYQRAQRWYRHRQYLAADRTIGLLGLGELGSDAARRLLALGFNVAGWSRRSKSIEGVSSSTDLSSVLERSNAVVCLLPLTPHTKNVLNERAFKTIRKGGCIINLARGGHVVTKDLVAALDSGHLAHAYLDVFETEPLPEGDPLWKHPKVSITPHAAALTDPRTALPRIVQNIERARRGEPPLNLVDRAAGY